MKIKNYIMDKPLPKAPIGTYTTIEVKRSTHKLLKLAAATTGESIKELTEKIFVKALKKKI